MGIALLTLSHLFHGLQRLSRGISVHVQAPPTSIASAASGRASAQCRTPAEGQHLLPSRSPIHRSGPSSRLGLALGKPMPSVRRLPLRVLRITDSQAQPGTLGRLVMSGRMGDVCAELDRLAALEAQQLLH